jgi:mRNA-degrading endonuclease toxin of MazEF toxin-antitoxin module
MRTDIDNVIRRESAPEAVADRVSLTEADGLPTTCAVNFDNLQTVPKSNVGDRIARLTTQKMKETGSATSFALGFDAE